MRVRGAVLRAIMQQNATVLISFLTGMVIARLLTPSEVGAYAVAMAAVNLIFAIKDSGLSLYVVSHAELDQLLLKSAFGLSLTVSAALTALFVVLSWPLASFYRDPALGEALRILAVAQIPTALAFPATVELIRALRFDILLGVGVMGAACQSAIAISLAFAGESTASLGWGYLIGAVSTAAGTIVARPQTMRLRPSLVRWRQLLSFGTWMSATVLVASAGAAFPELMLGRVLGLGNAALFSRAQNVVSIVRNGFTWAVMRPLLPTMAECERDGRGLAGISLRVIECITGLTWPAYVVLIIWAEPLIKIFYGAAWSGAAGLIAPIALAQGLPLALVVQWEVLIVKRRPGLLFFCQLICFLLTAAAVGTGLFWGLKQAAWAFALAQLVFTAICAVVLKGLIGLRLRALVAVWKRSLCLVVAAAAPALLFWMIPSQSPIRILLNMAASGVISAVLWVVAISLTSHELRRHVEEVLTSAMDQGRQAMLTLRSLVVFK